MYVKSAMLQKRFGLTHHDKGLRFIHNAGVIHLDFKPANIFITAYGRFKIGDFGMASLWPRPTESNHGLGSESHTAFEREGDKMYLAAEVLQGIYGKETDIFRFVAPFPSILPACVQTLIYIIVLV